MAYTIDESVTEYLAGIQTKMNPALYFTPDTGLVSVESQLSPHDGQILLADLQWAGNALDNADLTADDICDLVDYLRQEAERDCPEFVAYRSDEDEDDA